MDAVGSTGSLVGEKSTSQNFRQTVRFFCPVPPKVFVGGWAWELRTMESNKSTIGGCFKYLFLHLPKFGEMYIFEVFVFYIHVT